MHFLLHLEFQILLEDYLQKELLMLHLFQVIHLKLAKGKTKSKKFADQIFNLLFLGLFFLVLIIEIFMPIFVGLIAPGFIEDTKKIRTCNIFN